MDFDDLIFHTVKLLQNDAEAREYYQNRFRYVVVDEYQDTSIAQFHLVRLLAGGTNNVCVVGDDDQSIYKFRGATIENILNFEKVFTGAKTIRLEQNYRSTANILNAANSVIKNNMGRKGKTLWTDHGDGEKVHHYTATNEQDEASHIADVIGEHLREGASLKDHAVLYRMNAQSNPIETYFARAGIPYRIVGGQRFFDRKEVKDINSYLAIIVNPRDDVRLRRIINEPARKIGMTTIEKIGELAASKGVPMMEIIAHVRDYPELQRAAAALERFYEMYRELCDLSVSEPLDQFVGDVIAKSGYEAMLKAMKEEGETRRENLGQLVSSIKTYADQNGEEQTPVVLHRAILGSLDRFMAYLIEETKGKFPTWLAPVQVKVLPVSEKTLDYAQDVTEKLVEAGIRVALDDDNQKIGYKIRAAQQVDRVPYMLVLGAKEAEAGNISVRDRKGETTTMELDAFIAKVTDEIKNRTYNA